MEEMGKGVLSYFDCNSVRFHLQSMGERCIYFSLDNREHEKLTITKELGQVYCHTVGAIAAVSLRLVQPSSSLLRYIDIVWRYTNMLIYCVTLSNSTVLSHSLHVL